jgi:hypothetical protein
MSAELSDLQEKVAAASELILKMREKPSVKDLLKFQELMKGIVDDQDQLHFFAELLFREMRMHHDAKNRTQ